MTRRQKIIHIVVIDVLVLSELAAAMFFAHAHQEHFTPVFAGVFFGLLIPTMLASRAVVRRMEARDAPQVP